MTIRANAVLQLQGDWTVSGDRIRFHFLCFDPGPGEANDYYIEITLAEFDAATNTNQLDTLITSRLAMVIRGSAITAKAGTLIGKNYTVA